MIKKGPGRVFFHDASHIPLKFTYPEAYIITQSNYTPLTYHIVTNLSLGFQTGQTQIGLLIYRSLDIETRDSIQSGQ